MLGRYHMLLLAVGWFNIWLIYLSPDSLEGAAAEIAASPPTESENATCVAPVTVDDAPELLLLVE